MSSGPTATPKNNIKIKKRLTTFALVIALMTGSVAQLAVLLYRGARIIVVSSLSFAGENGLVAWEQDRLQQQTIKTAMQKPSTVYRYASSALAKLVRGLSERLRMESTQYPAGGHRSCARPVPI